jgi:hypothetical protein
MNSESKQTPFLGILTLQSIDEYLKPTILGIQITNLD